MTRVGIAITAVSLLIGTAAVRVLASVSPSLRGEEKRELFLDNRDGPCPPPAFDALPDFDLDSYISARWYIQKQIPVSYQPLDKFFCVTADYTKDDKFCLFCNFSPVVSIDNELN